MRIAFVIRSLQYGGAERQLLLLTRGLVERGHEPTIVQLFDENDFDAEVRATGARHVRAEVRSRRHVVRAAKRLLDVSRDAAPDILHGFHVESNLLCLLARTHARLRRRRTRVVFGVRETPPGAIATDFTARTTAFVHRKLAPHASLVLANSTAGAAWAAAAGVPLARLRVVANGVDTSRFRPDARARNDVRNRWGVALDDVLVGCVARVEPRKRPELFVAAAAAFRRLCPRARFVWVGRTDPRYRELVTSELDPAVIWAGPASDTAAVFNALDVATLVSVGEGTPNAALEALACGVPAVVTNSGDAARCVGDPRLVAHEDSPDEIAAAWKRSLELATPQWRADARRRVERDYSVDAMVDASEAAFLELLRA